MTKRQSMLGRRTPGLLPDPFPAGMAEEEAAIRAGVLAGDAALARLSSSGVLLLFLDDRPSNDASPGLTTLRSYAELKHVLRKQSRDIPASRLERAGYTAAENARFDANIASESCCKAAWSGTRIHAVRAEKD